MNVPAKEPVSDEVASIMKREIADRVKLYTTPHEENPVYKTDMDFLYEHRREVETELRKMVEGEIRIRDFGDFIDTWIRESVDCSGDGEGIAKVLNDLYLQTRSELDKIFYELKLQERKEKMGISFNEELDKQPQFETFRPITGEELTELILGASLTRAEMKFLKLLAQFPQGVSRRKAANLMGITMNSLDPKICFLRNKLKKYADTKGEEYRVATLRFGTNISRSGDVLLVKMAGGGDEN